ncbi:hypothetical protein [Streptomyces sp. NPDC020141]|uniref:hypothetical protein n=1 Tax=Streptomyces sp. NPDC020141 TaxID=3365065 RepID=UPI0037A5457C
MGIESDQLVYDYLSRVGDLAQQRQLPSGDRMRLVASLRGEIDRRRAGAAPDSPAAVRRILDRMGTPDEVVESAGAGGGAAPASGAPAPARPAPAASGSGPAVPEAAAELPRQRMRRRIPRPRRTAAAERPTAPPSPPPAPAGALPPHLAGLDELGSSDADVDWWSVTPQPFGPGERVAGFTGGVEIPEILTPPPAEDDQDAVGEKAAKDEGAAKGKTTGDPAPDAPGAGRRLAGLLRRRRAADAPVEAEAVPDEGGPEPRALFANPLLLLAAALLVGGALFGSWIALGLGWVLAYLSRRLTPVETKIAVFGLPGTALAAGAVWLWGRTEGRWGEPVPQEGMAEAISAAWPWVLKGAALASAVYLVWRARRR